MEKHISRLQILKRQRRLRGWSQAYVAEMVGSDPKTVSRWEQGKTSPGPYFVRQLIELFGKNAEELGLLVNEEKYTRTVEQVFSMHEDWGEAPQVISFYGREQELVELKQWVLMDHCRLILVLGLGGIGKTTLVTMLAQQIKGEFRYVFWCSLRHAPTPRDILEKCILLLENQQRADLSVDIDELISLLISFLRERRTLLILDNFESVLQSRYQAGQYLEGYEGYGKLLLRVGEAEHQSCLLVTSREKPGQISYLEGKTLPVRSIQLFGVGQDEGRKLLEDAGLFGTDEAWAELVRFYAGNPLALKLIAEPIREVFGDNVAAFLKGGETVFGDVYNLLDQQFHRLSELEQEVIYWLAIAREDTSIDELRSDMLHYVAQGTLVEALHSLRRRSMIETNAQALFMLQPEIMEYVTARFVKQIVQEFEVEEIRLLSRHTLIKARTKDYVRNSQIRFILAPVVEKLLVTFGKATSEKKLRNILAALHMMDSQQAGYAAGNIINILVQLQSDLRGADFSNLTIQQANLRDVDLPEVNFANAHFAESIFTDTFGGILCVAFNATGDLLAAGTADGEIRLWQVASGASLQTYQGHTDGVRSIIFSLDGKVLISGSEDHTVRCWDVHTGRCIKVLRGHSSIIRSVASSPHEPIVASASEDQTIRLWDINTGSCIGILRGHTDWVRSVAFSPAGRVIASGSNDRSIKIWDISTGTCLANLWGHAHTVRTIAFGPIKNIIVSAGDDETIRVWDFYTGRCLHILHGHTYPIRSVAFSPNGRLIASGGDDQTIRLWDASSGHCLNILQEHTKRVWSVAFSPDGQFLVSGSEDQTIRFWDINAGRCLQTIRGYSNWIWAVAFSPNGRLLASGCEDQTIRLWDIEIGHCLAILQAHMNRVRAVSFTPDGRFLASASDDQTIHLWDMTTMQCHRVLRGHSHLIRTLAFSPAGSILASGSYDQTVRLWDVNSGRCIKTLVGGKSLILSVAFSPDGQLIASSSSDHTVRLWDVDTGSCRSTLQGHNDQIGCIAFSPDGNTLASGSDDQIICIWDITTGRCLRTLQGHTHWVRSIAFSPDGHTLASGSHDQTIHLWDTRTGHNLRVLRGHTSWIWSVALSPDGRLIASGSDDGTVKLWNAQSGECLKTLRGDRPYERMNITGVTGRSEVQKGALRTLGAIELPKTDFKESLTTESND